MAVKVLTALYGSSAGGADVTQIVQNRLNQGYSSVRVNNTDLGGDPTPGIVKQFGISYVFSGGSPRVLCADEGAELTLVK